MTSTPLFSILIANYNNGQYLEECLQSVFNQTYTNWEIILIDDASTDRISHELYEKYKYHQQIKIFFNQENKGCGYTKMRCAEEATGQICAFLDPDDTITPNALEIMVNKHIVYPDYSLVYSTHYICDNKMNILKVSDYVGKIPQNHSHLSHPGPRISQFATFKNSYYKKTIGINPKLPKAVDQDLYYKIEEVGSILFLDEPLYYYRHHKGSISLNTNFNSAIYWNLVVSNEAHIRRKKGKSRVPNISMKALYTRWLNYHHNFIVEELRKKKRIKAVIHFFKALKYLRYDKNLNTLKLGYRIFFKKN